MRIALGLRRKHLDRAERVANHFSPHLRPANPATEASTLCPRLLRGWIP
jgi:hypothetical protein